MNIYDKQYKELGFKAQRLYPNEELLRFLGTNFFHLPQSERKNIKILEIGVGSGSNIWMISKEGFSAFGFDISKYGIELCREMLKKWKTTAKLYVHDMTQVPYPHKANYFDGVVDIVSMQHIPFSKHLIVYKEINRILKPKGLFFSYHLSSNSYSFRHGGGKLIDKFTVDNVRNVNAPLNNNGIMCFPTKKQVEKLLIKAGFKNICIEYVIKTYNNCKLKITYMAIKAEKPQSDV